MLQDPLNHLLCVSAHLPVPSYSSVSRLLLIASLASLVLTDMPSFSLADAIHSYQTICWPTNLRSVKSQNSLAANFSKSHLEWLCTSNIATSWPVRILS